MNGATRITPPATPLRDDSGGQHHSGEDLTLYAMRLLQDSEAEPIAQHLRTCEVCREEMARIYGDLGALALTSEAATPSRAARQRFLAELAGAKKLSSAPVQATSRPAPARVREVPMPAGQRPTARSIPDAESHQSLADFGRRTTEPMADPVVIAGSRSSIFSWAGWAVAAAMAVVSILLYMDQRKLAEDEAAQSSTIERMNALAQNSRQLVDALTDPQALRVTLAPKAPTHAPIAGVTYNARKGTLILLASNLDPLQTYKTYELWVIPASGAPVPAGTFHPDEHGNASVILPNLPRDIKAKSFGVTIEDAGGAEKPTMPIIMAGS